MARTPRTPRTLQTPAHRRQHNKTSPGEPPNEAALDDNDARLEAARQAAAAALPRRNPDGTFAAGVKPVMLKEPPRPHNPAQQTDLDWALSGTDRDTDPVTLMQPPDQHRNNGTETRVEVPIREFVQRVHPERSFIQEMEQDDIRKKRRDWLFPVFITLFFLAILGLFFLRWYGGS